MQWRRHLHQNPELSNRETETARYVADRLRSFGLEPQTGIARTGVVALLRGGRPGPVVALRADMDGLPVREELNLPFASKATAEYEGGKVGVMHACGHDTHVAILLATARVLTQVKDRLPGSVKFIFQPAEEGAPLDERPAGAEKMIAEGVMQNPKVDAVFGLHVFANVPTGTITYRSGPFMAAADQFDIIVTGKQTHGSAPWRGVDPIVVGSQIVTALQTIVSRNVDITRLPAIVSVGQFQSGVRNNIIPETARLVGTIRTFDDAVQNDIHARVKKIAEGIAAGAGATVDVKIHRGYPVTANDPALTARMLPTLEPRRGGQSAAVGADHRRRGLHLLSAAGAGTLRLPRHHAAGTGGQGAGQPLAAVLCRREGAADRRACPDAPGLGLSVRAPEMIGMTPKFFKTPADLRDWFDRHHATATELLVGYYKKTSGKASVDWSQSVDEALCVGWIDGVRRSLDDERYTIRFTPRKPSSIWSAINIKKVKALSRKRRMRPAGLKAFASRRENKSGVYSYEQRPDRLIAPYDAMLKKNKAAAAFFEAQPASYRRAMIWWVISAKQEETRARRAAMLVDLSARGERHPQFTKWTPKRLR